MASLFASVIVTTRDLLRTLLGMARLNDCGHCWFLQEGIMASEAPSPSRVGCWCRRSGQATSYIVTKPGMKSTHPINKAMMLRPAGCYNGLTFGSAEWGDVTPRPTRYSPAKCQA
jgi:hypothetical protein